MTNELNIEDSENLKADHNANNDETYQVKGKNHKLKLKKTKETQ